MPLKRPAPARRAGRKTPLLDSGKSGQKFGDFPAEEDVEFVEGPGDGHVQQVGFSFLEGVGFLVRISQNDTVKLQSFGEMDGKYHNPFGEGITGNGFAGVIRVRGRET